MPQDHLTQIHAAAVVTVGRRRCHAPERLGHELTLERPIEVSLPEVRAEIVALEVGEDALHAETSLGRLAQRRQPRIVRHLLEPRARRGEQAIEAALLQVVFGLDIGDAAIRSSLRSGM